MRIWVVGLLICAVSGCVTASRPLQFLSGADLVYPPAAKADGIEGYVVIRYDVSVDGAVINAEVVESEPEGVFDQAALESISQWLFRPPVVRGKVTETLDRVSTLSFKLGESDDYSER